MNAPNERTYAVPDDTMIGTPPTVDPDTAGRGTDNPLPGITTIKSISQDGYMDYSNNTSRPSGGGD